MQGFNGTTRTACALATLPANSAFAAADTGVAAGPLAFACLGLAAAIVVGLFAARRLRPTARRLDTWLGRQRLRRALASSRMESIANFIVPGSCDGLSRIDCAVLTSAGIVCLRVLHGDGTVFGKADEPQWRSVHTFGERRFLNPLIQNEGRVRALGRILPDMRVASLVVFTGEIEFATRPGDNAIHIDELSGRLTAFANDNPSHPDPEAAWLSLRAAAMTDSAARRDFEAQLSFG